MNTSELVGTAEIAERLGVGTSAVANWRARGVIVPLVVLKCGPVYDWRAVERVALSTGRVCGVHALAGRDAVSMLSAVRDQVLAELREQLAACDALLLSEPLKAPGARHGGEYDFLDALTRGERLSLLRNAFARSGGLEPDVWAMEHGYDTIDDAMSAWLSAVRLSVAIRARRWGSLTCAAGYDLARLFGADGAAYLAAFMSDEYDRPVVTSVHTFNQEEEAF